MNEALLHLDQPLPSSETPAFAERLEIAARFIQTVMMSEQFERLSVQDVQDVPEKSAATTGVSLTYQRGALTVAIDIWDDDCQYTDTHRCFAFRFTFWLGLARETMPFNRRKWGHPLRQQWRQRTDSFLSDFRDELNLLETADVQGRFHGVVSEVHQGYGFIRSPRISHLYFDKSQLHFPVNQLVDGLPVSFFLGEGLKGREAQAIEISATTPASEPLPFGTRDHATARPGPTSVQLLERPLGADEEGRTVGRVHQWPYGKNFGYIECLVAPRLFLHSSGLVGQTRGGPQLVGQGVRFRLAEGSDGRRQAVQATLLPEAADLRTLLQAELDRAELDHRQDGQRALRFRSHENHPRVSTSEKRPSITVAALKDMVEGVELIFVHTRWQDLKGLQHQAWRQLFASAAQTYPFGAPSLVYCSTLQRLYRLSDLDEPVPTAVEFDDPALKRQLELAAPHLDD